MRTLAVLGILILTLGGYKLVRDYIISPPQPPRQWTVETLDRYKSTLQVDINFTPADSLELVPGIGPVLSRRIVAYRETHGPYLSIDSLLHVSGIGPAKLNEIRFFIIVSQ